MSNIITLKDNPQMARIVKMVAPNYRKHKAILREADSFTNNGTFWDGSSRSSHWLVTGHSVRAVPGPTAPGQFGGGKPVTIKLPVGSFVVTLGTFRGKTATASITVGTGDTDDN